MAQKVLTDPSYYLAIADAIRAKGVEGKFKPSEMAEAILRITGEAPKPEFDWSNQGKTFADNQVWWNSLADEVSSMSADERAAYVGKEATVYLSESLLGLNANAPCTVICIGADQDGEGTLTFHTKGAFPSSTQFGGSDCLWASSWIKEKCDTFANICSASSAMKSITKLTASSSGGSTNNTADVQTTGKCWLPSACEMNATGAGASQQEYTKGGSQTPYTYYKSNSRAKKAMSATGTIGSTAAYYFLRSRYYSNTYVTYVDRGGNVTSVYPNTSNSFAPAFTIGKEG